MLNKKNILTVFIVVISVSVMALPTVVNFKKQLGSTFPQKVSAQSNQFVSVQNGHLYLQGQPYKFTGINAYELATDWGTNPGCGGMLTDNQMNSFFASLKPYSMVRMWGFQGSMAINYNTHQIDWGPLDRAINAASAHNIKLDIAIGDQAGTCDDDYWKDIAWYQGGYKNIYTSPLGYDFNVMSYSDYVTQLVSRYANNSTIALWEPINEPEASECANPNQATTCEGSQTCINESASEQALRSFFDNIGAQIRSIDPNHLIASGTLGSGQCGTSGGDYQTVMSSPGINVASYHDYSSANVIIPGDQWNGLQVRINQMAAINKPLIDEEVGINAYDPAPNGCYSLQQRSNLFENKLVGQFAAGVQGFMPWDWVPPGSTNSCVYDINTGDPALTVLSKYAFVLATQSAGPSNTSSPTSTVTTTTKLTPKASTVTNAKTITNPSSSPTSQPITSSSTKAISTNNSSSNIKNPIVSEKTKTNNVKNINKAFVISAALYFAIGIVSSAVLFIFPL